MDFVTGLPIPINWRGDSHNSYLVIFEAEADGILRAGADHNRCARAGEGDLTRSSAPKAPLHVEFLVCYFRGFKQRLSNAFYSQLTSPISSRTTG